MTTTDPRPAKFVFGPDDGLELPADVDAPDQPAYSLSPFLSCDGHPVVARYLPAVDEEYEPGRRTFVFDGWYINPPGPSYGRRIGGMKAL